jgi:hypothetical protein
MSVWNLQFEVICIVKTTCLELFGKSDEIRRAVEIPMLVCPELSGSSYTGVHFIDN